MHNTYSQVLKFKSNLSQSLPQATPNRNTVSAPIDLNAIHYLGPNITLQRLSKNTYNFLNHYYHLVKHVTCMLDIPITSERHCILKQHLTLIMSTVCSHGYWSLQLNYLIYPSLHFVQKVKL